MNQIDRIREMEQIYDRLFASVNDLKKAFTDFSSLSKELEALESYYTDGAWIADFEDDERGLLPKNLKRGVLSEDGVYNLLDEIASIKRAMKKLS